MIKIVPMTNADYHTYLAKTVVEYAAEKVQAGNWTEAESLERSRLEFEHYLPQGVQTPGNFVNKLLNEGGETVGYLWYARQPNRPEVAFIYDFEIYAGFRRRGYADQALNALAAQARTQGFRRIELHVFGHNTAARELYKKAGYIETNIQMARDL